MRIGARAWLVAGGMAGLLHLALAFAVFWNAPSRIAPEKGDAGIAIALSRIVDQAVEPDPEPEPEPEPEAEPETEPEPEPERPPEPEVTPQAKPKPKAPRAPLPEATAKLPDPKKTAPKPSTSAPGVQVDAPPPSYLAVLRSWFERHKVYPRAAQRRGQEGGVEIAITVGPGGEVLDARIIKSSGYPLLDRATLEMARRASPVPEPPAEFTAVPFTVTLRMVYRLR